MVSCVLQFEVIKGKGIIFSLLSKMQDMKGEVEH